MSEEQHTTRHVNEYKEPVEIMLSRSAKGQYYWKITVKAETPQTALQQTSGIDSAPKYRYLTETPTIRKQTQAGAE
jgi:hypothetical protein